MAVQSKPGTFKITYATLAMGGNDEFHDHFTAALDRVRQDFGGTHGHRIGGKEARSKNTFDDTSPINTQIVLGHFAKADEATIESAIESARKAWPAWRDTPWQERVAILRRAAEAISRDKYELAALMSYEVGKNRLEAMGDVEESADLIRYYCQQMEDAHGYEQPLGSLSPNEHTKSVLRPVGVWAVVCPFNFPLALAAGMSAGALVAGNTVVFKPSSDAPYMAHKMERLYQEAGVPHGVFNLVTGSGDLFGKVITASPHVGGIIFTGSKAVGMTLYHAFSQRFPRPTILEMGGKNPAIVMPSADLDKATDGVMRSAFGMGGQKCSACSRAYVHAQVYDKFVDMLVEKTRKIVIGDPTVRDVYLGPIINKTAHQRFKEWAGRAKKDGKILTGGHLLDKEPHQHGYFVEPTVVTGLPLDHPMFYEELFVPMLPVAAVDSLEQALELSNRAEYGLTAGIFSDKQEEIDHFFNEIESGVLYANRRSGATTGAWPGVQSFCGWKGSGSTGKGGCGPYYVQQFMREQSRTVMS